MRFDKSFVKKSSQIVLSNYQEGKFYMLEIEIWVFLFSLLIKYFNNVKNSTPPRHTHTHTKVTNESIVKMNFENLFVP